MSRKRNKAAKVSRRDFIKKAGAASGLAVGSGVITGFPFVHAADPITLRYASTAVTQDTRIADQLRKDTGINIQYIPLTSDDVVKTAVTQPNRFDILEPEVWMVKKIVPSGNLQGMDRGRIKQADNITTVFTKGEVNGKKIGDQGTAPVKVMHLTAKDNGDFTREQTNWLSLIPTVYNADTLGIRPDLIGRPIRNWHELLNSEFKGKASILNIPSIGIMDAAMVVESLGEHKYKDKGNMTKEEIDLTIKVLTEAKKAGQFRAFWKEFNESVNLMASGEVVIQSMWSPAVTKVRSMGIPCVYQPLEEGYRAWASGISFSKNLKGKKLDAGYEFINWYLSGWAGAFLNRQGYYNAVLTTSEASMEPYEWDYWMKGKPAAKDILAPDGTVMEKAGAVRDGGSFEDRMGAVACWNAVMDENRYMVRKWNEFIAA
ncbi:MAG: extracellular solute-binding protein [Gammaproteobacteria bacterium]|nr:extracellular solute-binding protein [Gammaproteobacteria bacterium]NIP87602.1 extracellular solute-binding protein [Gammaproteobacteria bacterium]NIR21927.1 extracellular solute-binding protein [Gammaproteobacteria bacterium]NIS03623.1 extracellular solute-binding protein [Gammaproteobacteria bacterium]NIU40637.1 extracellular solute-binding protein [Gammaproteobacteria bacterium]